MHFLTELSATTLHLEIIGQRDQTDALVFPDGQHRLVACNDRLPPSSQSALDDPVIRLIPEDV